MAQAHGFVVVQIKWQNFGCDKYSDIFLKIYIDTEYNTDDSGS